MMANDTDVRLIHHILSVFACVCDVHWIIFGSCLCIGMFWSSFPKSTLYVLSKYFSLYPSLSVIVQLSSLFNCTKNGLDLNFIHVCMIFSLVWLGTISVLFQYCEIISKYILTTIYHIPSNICPTKLFSLVIVTQTICCGDPSQLRLDATTSGEQHLRTRPNCWKISHPQLLCISYRYE